MSINVNVTGNPVSINRGKLIAADPDYAMREFHKRRRIRMEQVRQQSRDIAETVRNNVRREQNRQLLDVERRGQEELKKWQARKLLQLQQQYQERLKDIGLAHSDAILEEESDAAWESQQQSYQVLAKERGKQAAERLQKQRQQECANRREGLQKRQYNQAVEGVRSKMVVNLKNKTKVKSPFKRRKRKVSADANTTSDSESETEVPELLNLSNSSSCSSPGNIPLDRRKTSFPKHNPMPEDGELTEKHNDAGTKNVLPFSEWKQPDDDLINTKVSYPVDTRISDRIKSRSILPSNSNTCNTLSCDSKVGQDFPSCSHNKFFQFDNNKKTVSPKEGENMKVTAVDMQSVKPKEDEIPSKPTVTMRSDRVKATAQQPTSLSSSSNKVQYYDHKNRFSKEYIADTSRVQRIPEESIEVCPSTGSEAEFIEKMHKRDQEAESRGQKALEKERVRRDYQKLMKQLPQLQKQERIATMQSRKPVFHMSDDHLKRHEQERQNRMENAYEKLFPKARVITLPPKVQAETTDRRLPFQTIDMDHGPKVLNVGSWDVDHKSNSIPNRVSDVNQNALQQASCLENGAAEKKENLQEMLRTLKLHRDRLVKELAALPESSNLHKLFGELGSIDQLIKVGEAASKNSSSHHRKRSRNARTAEKKQEDLSKASTASNSPPARPRSPSKERDRSCEKEKQTSKYHTHCTSTSSTSPSPPSKLQSTTKSKTDRRSAHPPPIILQSTSTQTTPVVDKAAKGEDLKKPPKQSEEKKERVEPCDCHLHEGKSSDNLCKILIKFNENEKPQICISPTRLKDKQVVIKTGVEESSRQPILVQDVKPAQKPKSKSKVPEKSIKVSGSRNDKSPKQQPPTSTSWREYLSQNSTSSTSYLSPPDFMSTLIHPRQTSKEKAMGHFINILRDKPQQGNLPNDSSLTTESSIIQGLSRVQPDLVTYIKRLLMMSRKSIDDLAVSSVSEISTPSSSIINVQTNIYLNQLQNIMKHFNINASDAESLISQSQDVNTLHYNTAESLTLSSTGESHGSSKAATSHDEREATANSSAENYPKVLAVYNKLAQNCTKKIENLAAMIEKVRQEKVNILRSPPDSASDKENSTKYFELPIHLQRQGMEENTPSPESIAEQEELDRQLLEVDYDFAEQLKKMTPAEIREKFPLSSSSSSSSSKSLDGNDERNDSNADELMIRYKNLLKGCAKVEPPKETKEQVKESKDTPFVPFVMDIPRLPKFESSSIPTNGHPKTNQRPKPPPSKGLLAAKRFNTNIAAVPHELSTIAESESLMSSKLHRSKTPESQCSSRTSSPKKELEVIEDLPPIIILPEAQNVQSDEVPDGPASFRTTVESQNSSNSSLPDILVELVKNAKQASPQKDSNQSAVQKNTTELASDSSASELENMEAVLKSMGMGWAIATLRKTQEALALTSSSSSTDMSLKQKDLKGIDMSSTTDVSLKGPLGRYSTRILSNSDRCEESSSSLRLLGELLDLSSIHGSDRSQEKTTRRTSTPVQSSKTTDKSKNDLQAHVTRTDESQSSSVKASSDGPFYSLNEFSIRSRNSTKND